MEVSSGTHHDADGTLCPACGARRASPEAPCPVCAVSPARREDRAVRNTDLEPYTTLRYIGRLFKLLSGLIVVALFGELVLGAILEGTTAVGTFLGEAMRLVALAGLLWAGGDLVRLVIDAGHDVRLSRILLGRIHARVASSSSAPFSRQDRRRAS
jgi:hypothetical protein